MSVNGFSTCLKAYSSDLGSSPPAQTARIETDPPICPKDGAASVPPGALLPPPPPDAPGDAPELHAASASVATARPAASRDAWDRRSIWDSSAVGTAAGDDTPRDDRPRHPRCSPKGVATTLQNSP